MIVTHARDLTGEPYRSIYRGVPKRSGAERDGAAELPPRRLGALIQRRRHTESLPPVPATPTMPPQSTS